LPESVVAYRLADLQSRLAEGFSTQGPQERLTVSNFTERLSNMKFSTYFSGESTVAGTNRLPRPVSFAVSAI
jgi:hypothetical protein